MAQPLKNSDLQLQQSGSGLVEFFNLSRLVQTIDSIANESKDEDEMFQLVVNALCIFTGWPLGHIFLRGSIRRDIFSCSNIHYVNYFDLYGESHQRALLNVYDESSEVIKQMVANPVPSISRSFDQHAQIDLNMAFRVFIPIVNRGELLGFFELIALEKDEPDQFLMRVFYQIGDKIGAVFDSFMTSKELRKFRLAVEHSSDHIIITDSDAYILYANKAAEKMTGYSHEEMIGQRPSLWGKNMSKEFYESMWGSIKTHKQPFIGEVNNTRKDGSHYITGLHISPVLGKDGNVEFFVGIERDITKEKEVDRMKDEFLNIAAHELRTPLTAIRWNTSLIMQRFRESLKDEEVKGMIEDMHASSLRLTEIVNDFLDVSRLEAGRIEFKKEAADLKGLIKNSLEGIKIVADKKGLYLKFEEPKEALPEVLADKDRVNQVVINLVGNAIKFTEKGGVSVEVAKEGGLLKVRVKDTGVGIAKDTQKLLFQKFQQSGKGSYTRDATKGTGLGLYISKLLVEGMGGKIYLEKSEPNKGSTFAFTLPAAKATSSHQASTK